MMETHIPEDREVECEECGSSFRASGELRLYLDDPNDPIRRVWVPYEGILLCEPCKPKEV